MHLYSQCIQRDAESRRESFATDDLFGLFMSIVFRNNLTIFLAQTPETPFQALMIICDRKVSVFRRRLNKRAFIERPHSIPPLLRLDLDQFGDTIDIAGEVIEVLTLVDSPRNSIDGFIGIDVRHVRSAPLEILQQLEADVLILLPRLVSICVECGEKAVERGLSENPFAFGWDFGETHVLNTFKTATFISSPALHTPSLCKCWIIQNITEKVGGTGTSSPTYLAPSLLGRLVVEVRRVTSMWGRTVIQRVLI